MSDLKTLLERADRAVADVPLPADGLGGLQRRRDRKRRNQRIAAGVVGMAVFVAAVWIVTSVGSLDRSETSVVPGGNVTGPAETGPAETGPTALEPVVPPPGIPPHGATPSFPETGELILSVSLFTFNVPPAPEELTHMYVYTDGRLIWSRDSDLLESTDAYNTGLVEQRLTPEGAELMRSEVISSGLIDPDSVMVDGERVVMVDGEADPDTFPFVGFIAVRDADRLFGREFASAGYETGGPNNEGETTCVEGWGCAHIATAEEERRLQSLYARLTDPASWLPASAWADQEIRAYVPSRYQVCYGGMEDTIERDRLLHAIPGPVQELLEARDAENEHFNGYLSFGDYFDGVRVTGYCSDLTIEEARNVVRGLDDGGFEREQLLTYANGPHTTFEYIFSVPDPAGTAALWIDPYLPHGVAICIPCT